MRLAGKILALLLLLALIVFLVTFQVERDDKTSTSRVDSQGPVVEPSVVLVNTQQAFIEVYRQVTPAVVNIRAEVPRSSPGGSLFEEFFGELFKNHPRQKQRSLGSGVLIDPDGHLLTNAHVISGADEIQVRLSDQRVYSAKIVGQDEKTDVAVLKIDSDEPLPVAAMGDSDALQVGEWALAIGNPFGLDRTLTVGVISAKGRSDVGIEEYEDFLQTDASINPGNSGGPLLNIRGEIVGINTAIVASGQGIGFAIPINMAKMIADQLIRTGAVRRGWLGVRIQELTPDLAETFNLDRTSGALITEVMPDTPADRAGLKRGDVILKFDGRPIRGVRDLQLRVANVLSGSEVEAVVLRDGTEQAFRVIVSDREDAVSAMKQPEPQEKLQGKLQLGFDVETDDAGDVRVSRVEAGSPAAGAGLRVGDTVLQVNDHDVVDLQSFNNAVSGDKAKGSIRLLVKRGESVTYLAFTLP